MSPQQVKTWYQKLGAWSGLIALAAGYLISWGTNALTTANRLEFLTQQVATMNVTLKELQDKVDQSKDENNKGIGRNSARLSALETKVFGRPVEP